MPIGQKLLLHSSLILCMTSYIAFSELSDALAAGTESQYEIDLKELEKLKGSPKPVQVKAPKATAVKPVKKLSEGSLPISSSATYTVKPGDNLFKILMRDFGFSNREAELRIPGLMRANDLHSSTSLTVGQKLVIPAERQAKTPDHISHRSAGKRIIQSPLPEVKTALVEAEQPVIVSEKSEPVSLTEPVLSIKSISGSDPDQTLDNILTALNVPWSKDKVIEGTAGPGNPESFSIKVERYLELEGKRYVLTSTRKDPYEYTFLRLLELAGYSVIRLDDHSGFSALAPQLLTHLGFTFSSGKHRFTQPDKSVDPRIIEGFLVPLKTPRSLVFITETPLDAFNAETLAASKVEPEKDATSDKN